MSEHRPTVLVQCDVFDDAMPEVTPRTVAENAWEGIQGWVSNGYQPVVTVLMEDGSEHEVDLSEEPERSEDDPHPVIERVTHVYCGTTFTDPFTIEVMNEMDSACPKCSEGNPSFPPPEAYGRLVWEHRDGTLWETDSKDDGEMLKHQRVITHAKVYKSWVNAPDDGEYWVVAEPGTGDLDDNLIVGFDHWWQARAAFPSLRSLFTELGPHEGIAFRDRHDPIYQLTQRGAQF